MALMPESWWVVILLGVMSVGVLVMTVTVLLAARDLRRTVRQASRMLPDCDKAVQEARRTLMSIRQLLARADHATRQVEGVIHKACDTASEVIGRVVFLKDKAEDFLAGRFGNGARSGPRQRYRR